MAKEKLRLMVVGGGGREHAIVWKLSQSPLAGEIYCAPGNAGIADLATCLPCPATDIDGLVRLAKEKQIDFTVVGMDDPLVMGIVDEFEANGLKVVGPNKKAAEIEGSKVFSKGFMKRHNIPTAEFEVFDDYTRAMEYACKRPHPLVIKTDGLAAGKGVIISADITETERTLSAVMLERKFGTSGKSVVVEEFMTGREISVLAFCDGNNVIPMVDATDYKRAFDGDLGLNTGGMGAISPSRIYTPALADECMAKIFRPTVDALLLENRPFKGVLYFGLMLTENGPKVVEYNCRFGDPEAQVIIPRLESDLLQILLACADGDLAGIGIKSASDIKWKQSAACCVILASKGYPEKYGSGYIISGLDKYENRHNLSQSEKHENIPNSSRTDRYENALVFHAGTKRDDLDNSKILTAGGRVLGITSEGPTIDEAVENAYKALCGISFTDMFFRKDIGK